MSSTVPLSKLDAVNAMLFDIGALEWSEDLCDLFGVPRHALPQVMPSAGVFGHTDAGCAAGTGELLSHR